MTKDQSKEFVRLAERIEHEVNEREFSYQKRQEFLAEKRGELREQFGVGDLEAALRAAEKAEAEARSRMHAAEREVDKALEPQEREWRERERANRRTFTLAQSELLAASDASAAKAVIERLAAL